MALEASTGRNPDDNAYRSTREVEMSRRSKSGITAEDYSSYSFLQLIVKALPDGVTTLEIYENFKRYGNLNRITIFENRESGMAGKAEIVYEPPPTNQDWLRRRIPFTSTNGLSKQVQVEISNRQPRNFIVEGPLHNGRRYNEKTEIQAQNIRFGVLTDPNTMLRLVNRTSDVEPVRLILNLRRKEIDIFFPSQFASENRVAVRTFRFSIALDENFTIWRLSPTRFVLHLTKTPWYSKQLREALPQTHSADAKRWSEEDTWARQTDMAHHKNHVRLLNQTPVSLQKNLNNINIARWRTFAIDLVDSSSNRASTNTFLSALRDFNITVLDAENFQFADSSSKIDLQVWNRINGISENVNTETLSSLLYGTLSFSVRYQLEVCLSRGWLSEYSITDDFMKKLSAEDPEKARQMLVYVDSYEEHIWDPMIIFSDLRYCVPVRKRPLPDNCMEIHSATVTATSVIFNTPTVEITNRIIRKYKQHADRFLRIRFEDDEYRGQSRLFATPNNKMILIFQRVRRVLQYGIKLGDVHYEFLAWGNSQLREHGAYFFAKTGNITASRIRAEMGAFDQEKVIAKRAARMGQCFSTTKPVRLRFPAITKANTIADIVNGDYNFSDGVGQISDVAAHLVQLQLKIKGPLPSAFQFRLGGCKGVLVVSKDKLPEHIKVRTSQFKFHSPSTELEIIRWSQFWHPFLNRQLILCMSDLGVPDKVFLQKQEEAIRALDAAMDDDACAIKALRDNVDPNLMTLSLSELVEAGFRQSSEPFVTSLLRLWRAWTLKYLKEKAKIPVSKGAFVLGCVDESHTLTGHINSSVAREQTDLEDPEMTLPEIFIQVSHPQTGKQEVITGICVLARNPSLHRGDIRVVMAVDRPELRHLCDVVVMPAQGDRDLPSMCSGGDLDGDDYVVIWDQDLIPVEWNADPFDYQPPPPKTARHEITTEDIINFFYDYMQNDYLGRIAHAHLAAGDYLDEGIQSNTCLELVKLHSMAVDYPKTGVPAIMERHLERNVWPHFMEKRRGNSYKSHKILGQLYDAVERVDFVPNREPAFDQRILNAGDKSTEQMMTSVEEVKHDYDSALHRLMAQHGIRSEFEVWSTFVIDHSKASKDYKFHEEIGRLSTALKDQYRQALYELAGGNDFEHLAPVAIAAYRLTHGQVHSGLNRVRDQDLTESESLPLTSFPWLLQDTLCKIVANTVAQSLQTSVTAIVENGVLTEQPSTLPVDEKGRALIQVANPLHPSMPTIVSHSRHLPDPLLSKGDPSSMHDPFKHIEPLGEELEEPVLNDKPAVPAKISQRTLTVTETMQKMEEIVASKTKNPNVLDLIRGTTEFSKSDELQWKMDRWVVRADFDHDTSDTNVTRTDSSKCNGSKVLDSVNTSLEALKDETNRVVSQRPPNHFTDLPTQHITTTTPKADKVNEQSNLGSTQTPFNVVRRVSTDEKEREVPQSHPIEASLLIDIDDEPCKNETDPQSAMEDPFSMTAEQLKDLDFAADMEL